MPKLAAILIFLAINLIADAQSNGDAKTPYYESKIHSNASYSEKIEAYKSLSGTLSQHNADSAVIICNEGIALALQHKDSINMGRLIQLKALSLNMKGNRDSCAYYLYQAAGIFNRNHETESLAWVYNDIARLYRRTSDFDKALEYYDKAFLIFKQLKNLNGIGVIYNESGVVFEGKGDFDEAIKRYNTSLQIQLERNDSVGIGYACDFLSGAYLQKNNLKTAEDYGLKALSIRSLLKDSFAIAINYSNLADIYTTAKKYDKATAFYLLSNQLAEHINYPDLLFTNYKQLSNLKKQQQQFEEAYTFLQLYNNLNDSIYKLEKTKQIQELSARYETAEKEKQIQQQQFEISKRNYYITAIIIVFVLCCILGYSFYRRYKLKQQSRLQNEIMHQQQMATKAVIEAEEKERKRIAGDLHDGVGQMMSAARMNLSAIFHSLHFNSDEQQRNYERVVSLIDESCMEVRTVSHNMMPNALVKAGLAEAVKDFADRIDHKVIQVNLYTEGVDERIDSNIETVLYRVIQESLNNVIKHANATILDISLIKDEEGIKVTIEDNGRGFNVSSKENYEGIGLKNIKTRVKYLKGSVEWDSAPGKGTVVAVYVPVI